MTKYLSPSLVLQSFERLREIVPEPKAGQEITSAIFYLLSFERVRKARGCEDALCLDPTTQEGTQVRALMRDEFSRLSVLCEHPTPGMFVNAPDLGSHACERKSPDKRIGSNFFTVPLKKASQSATPIHYPNRKHGPLLVLGSLRADSKWCIRRHPKWLQTLRKMLADRNTRTPFTDLAIYMFRTSKCSYSENVSDSLCELVRSHFCNDFAEELCAQLVAERQRLSVKDDPFSEAFSNCFKDLARVSVSYSNDGDVKSLKARISYLEQLLIAHKIPYR